MLSKQSCNPQMNLLIGLVHKSIESLQGGGGGCRSTIIQGNLAQYPPFLGPLEPAILVFEPGLCVCVCALIVLVPYLWGSIFKP